VLCYVFFSFYNLNIEWRKLSYSNFEVLEGLDCKSGAICKRPNSSLEKTKMATAPSPLDGNTSELMN
jgi:hypothetical protein